MKTIDILLNHNVEDILTQTVEVLNGGGVVLMPSDTCYGLSAKALSHESVKKIASIKQQSVDKPISVFLGNKKMLWDFVEKDPIIEEFIELYWPGPVTLILPLKNSDEFIGFRLPDHGLMQELSNRLNSLIYTSSANMHGKPEAYNVDQFFDQFNSKPNIDLVLDAGTVDFRPPSLVLKFLDNQFVVLREHPIIQNVGLSFSLKKKIN